MSQTTLKPALDLSKTLVPKPSGLRRQPQFFEEIIRGLLFFCGAVSILTTIGIIVTLGQESLYFFTNWNYLEINKATTAALTETDTTFELTSGGLPVRVGDVLAFDEEFMRVETVEGNTVTVTRGFDNSSAKAHEANRPVEKAVRVSLLEYFGTGEWAPQIGKFGIWPLLMATIVISTIGLIVAIPLGLGSAIFLSEYCSEPQRRVIKPILEILAGIPTVVLGFFALTFVSPGLRGIFGTDVEFQNMLAAGLTVGLILIPLVSTISEDALRAVPSAMREASYGLGATRFETAVKVLIPSALSGILAAVILAGSRAFGETMIVALAAGSGPRLTLNPFQSAETITGHIARISGGDISYHSVDYNSLFSLALVLFVVTLLLNIASNVISARFREAYQ
jgi:phosphate transport system permease protein